MENNEMIESIAQLSKKVADASAAADADRAALNAKIEKMDAALLSLEQKSASAAEGAKKALSVGEQFVASGEYKAMLSGQSRAVRIKLNTVTAPTVTDHRPGVSAAPAAPLTVESLFSAAPTSGNLIEYLKESTWTKNAAEVAEGAQKPESAWVGETVQAPVQVIAHFLKVTKQMFDDSDALAAHINARMAQGVAQRVDSQLLTGNGTAPNLAGVFTDGNYLPHGFTETDNATLLAKSIAAVQASGYNPTAILLNPVDFAAIAASATSNGFASAGNIVDGIPNRIWGVPVVVSSNMTKGYFLVGDFKSAGTVYTRQDITVEAFEQDGTNVQQNLITIRAEARKAFAIEEPQALVGGALVA